jgi:dTDP-4-dehydrorhamnose reductase
MKIVILGSRGNLGVQLRLAFAPLGEVVAWDREEFDLLRPAEFADKLKSLRPDVIINAAAYNAVDAAETEPGRGLATAINGRAVGVLAESALACGAKLIQYSTDYVFSGTKGALYVESDEPDPVSIYGESKLLGEQLIQKFNPDLDYYIIRTSRLFGPRGQAPACKPSFFKAIWERGKHQDKLEVVTNEIGNFTYTPDLAKATANLVLASPPKGIYHLVNSHPASWHDAAIELFRQQGMAKEIIPVAGEKFSRPARRPHDSSLGSEKLPLLRDYREALKEFLSSQSF